MVVELNGLEMTDRQRTHDYLAQMLQFPAYYGKNLDALYDLLTERQQPLEVRFIHTAQMKEQLGAYGSALLHTMQEAENDNLSLILTIC